MKKQNATEEKSIQTTRQIGDSTFLFFSDVYDGEKLDTQVMVNPAFTVICWIAANDINKFAEELNEVIKKYRI
jgi:hypothetical protein